MNEQDEMLYAAAVRLLHKNFLQAAQQIGKVLPKHFDYRWKEYIWSEYHTHANTVSCDSDEPSPNMYGDEAYEDELKRRLGEAE